MQTRIIRSTSVDPWYNLALEEHLFKNVGSEEVILYLWQNQGTVVIGRNQNAWKQCRCQQLEDDGRKLARRLSGGGAVFHDLGNLNFTFIMGRQHYSLQRQLEVILQAVRSQGIDARFSGRNDLTVGSKKFSGNAFYFDEGNAYHHGTIMVDVDFEDMLRYLQVSQQKIRSKAIDSVRSRVVNLKELNAETSIEVLKQQLAAAFVDVYGGSNDPQDIGPQLLPLDDLYQRYSSWQWRYGESPKFDVEFNHRFSWAEMQVCLSLRKGHIIRAQVYSDAMNATMIEEIAGAMTDLAFQSHSIAQRLDSLPFCGQDGEHLLEFRDWLVEQVSAI